MHRGGILRRSIWTVHTSAGLFTLQLGCSHFTVWQESRKSQPVTGSTYRLRPEERAESSTALLPFCGPAQQWHLEIGGGKLEDNSQSSMDLVCIGRMSRNLVR